MSGEQDCVIFGHSLPAYFNPAHDRETVCARCLRPVCCERYRTPSASLVCVRDHGHADGQHATYIAGEPVGWQRLTVRHPQALEAVPS